jgi:hypothetical protein
MATRSSRLKVGNWDLGALVVGALATALLVISILSKPQLVILNHTVVITQGIAVPAILVGALAWGAIEVFTPPGKGLGDLLLRSITGFVLGGLFGGLLGYTVNFGQYLVVPAFAGNVGAIFELATIFLLGMVVIWDAAWSHKRQYVTWGR